MSHTPTQLRQLMHHACMVTYQRQLDLLQSAHLVSAPTSRENLKLLLHLDAVSDLDPFPTIETSELEELSEIENRAESAQSTDELREARQSLILWLSQYQNGDFSEETIRALPSTENGLNKRMRDELFLTRGKIRSTRRRLRESGQDYDKEAYVSTRNQLLLVHRTYLEQLRLDLVQATHEGIAKVELLHLAISDATGDTFVASLSNLRDFILEQVTSTEGA
ncbi:MAG: hypothetical protein AAF544_03275 [Bacteroidota bacterium]